MALINCPACRKEISDKAESCPNCGHPINIKPKQEVTNAPPTVIIKEVKVDEDEGCFSQGLKGVGCLAIIIIIALYILIKFLSH